MRTITLKLVTGASDGACTVNGERSVFGRLYALEYRPGTIDTGATVTVTCEGASSKALLTKATAGTANTFYYPRDLVHAVADGAALTGTSGGDRCLPVLNGTPKVVIASGANSKTGYVTLYYIED